MRTAEHIWISLGEVLECHPKSQSPLRRKRYNSFDGNRDLVTDAKENVAPDVRDATCDPRSDGMKQRKPSERADTNGCQEDGLPSQPSAIGRRCKTRTASVDSNESDDPAENGGRLRRSNSFKHLAEDSCSSFLDKDDDEEISFHPDAIVQDEPSTNGNDSKGASPKRKSSDEKVLDDNLHYYQYEVCKGKTRSNKAFEGEGDDESDSCKKTEDFQNNFLKFLEKNNIKKEGSHEGRTRHKSGPSIGSKPRGKRHRTTSSCGRISPKSDDESGRGSRISVNESEDESRPRSRGRNTSRSSNARSRKRSASRTISRPRLEPNPLYSPSPSETGSNADSSVSNISNISIKKLTVEITRLAPEMMTPEPCLDSDAPGDDEENTDDSEEEEEPCTRTTRSGKIEVKSNGPVDEEGEESDEEEEELSTRTTRSTKTEVKSDANNDAEESDDSDEEDDEEEACLRTTRSAKSEAKSPKRTRRSELDKLFEAGVSSFHCESAAAERKRLSDLGTPLNIDCSDSCESEVNSVTSAKRKLSDIDCDNEVTESRKKSKKSSSSSRAGRGKICEASDSDNVSNNGNNLLKTISPARSKMTLPESDGDDDDYDDIPVWDGWERLEEELAEINSEPIDPDNVYCSFEHTPSHEGWFQTYSRQDRGEEIMFYPDIVGAPFLLPYEMSYASFLPSKQPMSQSIASSSGTTTPVRQAKLQQDRLVVRSCQGPSQPDRGSRRGTPRGGTPARSVADDSVKSKKCSERKVSVSESEHSTDSDGSRKGKSKFGPKSTHLLDLQPRISPRCHASTKALLNAGSVGDEDELADYLLMEEMSEGGQGGIYPFVAHDESSNDSTFSSVSQAGKSKSKSESIGEYMALAASLDRVLRQPDPELLTDKLELSEKPSCSKDVEKGKNKGETAVTATRSRISSEQLLSPKNKKDKTKKKKTVLGEAPMDLIVARAVDGVLLDCLEDELPTVPFDEFVPGSDVMSLLSDYKSCDSMSVCNSRWLRPKCGGAQPPRSLAVQATKDKSRQRSPARPKVIYKEDSEEDADVETTDVDSVSISSFGSTSSRKRGKKRKVNMTGFPSPKKKKKLNNKIIEQGPKILMPRKNKDKVPYRPKGFMQQVQNTVLEAAMKSKNDATPSKSEKSTKVKSETPKEKQPKIEKFLKRSPKGKEGKKTSPITAKSKNSPRRKSDDGAKRSGKRSKTVNYREQESDTESIFDAANMSPRSLKVPYRSKEFVLQQQALGAATSSKSAKVDKANKNLKKLGKGENKITRSKR